jgi:hypothetical protein
MAAKRGIYSGPPALGRCPKALPPKGLAADDRPDLVAIDVDVARVDVFDDLLNTVIDKV